MDLGEAQLGQPIRLTLTMALDTLEGQFAESASSSSDVVRLPDTQLVPFLGSNLGATVFEWWNTGLVPSVVIRKELGPEVLEAFQAQKAFLLAQNSSQDGSAVPKDLQ